MEYVLNKSGRPIVKSFLGQKPTRVWKDIWENPEYAQPLEGVTGYLRKQAAQPIVLPEILIASAEISAFQKGVPVIEIGKNVYVPIHVNFYFRSTGGAVPINVKGVFYINGVGKRPKAEHLFKHFKELIKAPYTGTFENEVGRYVICVDEFPAVYISALLNIAIKGDGTIIDYTWIAAFQDILDAIKDKKEKQNRPRKGNLKKNISSWSDMEEEITGNVGYDPLEAGYARPNRSISSQKMAEERLARMKSLIFGTAGSGSRGPTKLSAKPSKNNPPYIDYTIKDVGSEPISDLDNIKLSGF